MEIESAIYSPSNGQLLSNDLWTFVSRSLFGDEKAKKPCTIAFVGAGGKTSAIFSCLQTLRRQKKTVLVTTTTHMYEPAGGILGTDGAAIKIRLQQAGFALAGNPDGRGKIGYIGDAAYRQASEAADCVVLVEADGSRRLPLKCFGKNEPVLPLGVQAIVCVAGLSALGKTGAAACFRWTETPFVKRGGCIDEQLFAALLQQGCLRHLEQTGLPILTLLNQADTADLICAGQKIAALLDAPKVLLTQLALPQQKDRLSNL